MKESKIINSKSIAYHCNHIFAENVVENQTVNVRKNYQIFQNLKDGDSIFTKTDCLPELFRIISGLKTRLKIVTHESDYVIDDNVIRFLPENVERIFSINAVSVSEKVVPIPLGIANEYCKITLKPIILNEIESAKNCKALVSCNIRNNPKERLPLYNIHIDDQVSVRELASLQDYEKLLEDHTFVFCPEGNGPDTHRLWEALYLGKIPIVKKSSWNRNFRDLPALFVDDWKDAHKEERQSFLESFDIKEYNISKLDPNYWGELINE